MGKVVKYCSSCDESFAEKFGFCPTCGTSLQAFEMNPLVAAAPVEPDPPTPVFITEPTPEPVVEQVFTAPDPLVEATPIEEIIEPVVEPAPVIPVIQPIFVQTKAVDIDRTPAPVARRQDTYSFDPSDRGFHITVIEEKNVGQRATLLVGTLGMMIVILMGGMVYSIFSKDLDIGAINDDMFNAVLTDIEPMTVEEEIQKKEEKKGGGGGGGGRDEKEETTQGDLADQSKNPTRPPDAKVYRSDNFELKMPPPQTEGDQKFEKKFDKWGDPNGRYSSLSNGTGTGGGQGSGRGTGQGNGNGTGAGNGNGSGFGNGDGNGNGDGTGTGGSGVPPPPPTVVKPVGVTQGIKIISKPKATYTDAARQNQVQGNVTLRITFNANGSIGSITPVSGLGYGLTEQAIAAARQIRFEPAKVNGVAQTISKTFQYGFTIY